MTPDDLERLQRPSKSWRPDMFCADCRGAPSCPQLHDALWDQVWRMAESKSPRACNCAEWEAMGPRSPRGLQVAVGAETHWRACDVARAPLRRELLCLECAETRLHRRVTLGDLKPCLGNYHVFVAVHRLAERVADRVITLPIEVDGTRDDLVADLCELPRRRTVDQLIRGSSVGQGLQRVRDGYLDLEIRQHEICPRGRQRDGRHLWNVIPDEPAWSEILKMGYREHCACGASR